MPTNHLTAKQSEVYQFVKRYLERNGYAPTYREIGDGFGLSSGSISYYLRAIEARGLLTWNANESRSIKLTNKEKV